jgi:Protein of unknown function (DUF2809)
VPYSSRSIRLVVVALAVFFVAIAIAARLVFDGHLYSNGWWEQNSGTALYASAVYAGVLFMRPRINPFLAGGIALAFCWLVEAFQLTPIPAELSDRSLAMRLLLGRQFDWNDVAWYPVGILPLVAVDVLLAARSAHPSARRSSE